MGEILEQMSVKPRMKEWSDGIDSCDSEDDELYRQRPELFILQFCNYCNKYCSTFNAKMCST